ncbi:ABC transporter ATP-binding protein [Mucilaginibacter sp. L196]|uniref:ATP-binding cassette domain-containing protein n=1 Tax=Mucilaginibacter sp. L196 TaxID=1641870 RepID=UPI00131A9E55|nr:ABC transporter ATP-binding protein [Mucilaginibacter sp. L196]
MKREKMQGNNKNEFDNNFKYWFRFFNSMPRKQLLLSIFYGASRVAISAAWPFYLYRSLKEIGKKTYTQILIDLTLVAFMLALIAIGTHLQSKINIKILKEFTLELIDRIWKKMNALDWLTFHRNNRVYYFDMLMVETWRLRAGMAALLESLIINSLIAGVLSLFIIFISWPLFLICFGGLLLMGIGHYISTIKTRPLLKQFHHAWRAQHHWIAKCVDQFDLIKMDRAYETSVASNLKNSNLFLNSNTKLLTSQAEWRNMNQLLANIVRIAVFIIGILWVRLGVVTLNELLLVLLVVTIIQSNVMQMPAALNSFIEAQEALRAISAFFTLNDEQTDIEHPLSKLPPIQKMVIRDLSYCYDDKPAIDHVNIDLEVGKIYLWKGYNGSGKSTAAHILLGLLHPQHGSLVINDLVIDWKDLRHLRYRFAFLDQDSPIFMGSVKENALFGHTEPENAWNKLQGSWLSRLLPTSNQAAHRMVGERGEGLSGGEAKRVALIRELLRSSELLILDEPLNHLDEYAINEIKREILTIKAKTIIIIISHQTGFESIADEIKEF